MKNFKITNNISFFEATTTSKTALLKQNREAGLMILPKITLTAYALVEPVRHFVLGDKPIEVHSFFRSPILNGATKGSSTLSQHPRAEAIDWSRWGAETRAQCYEDFEKTRDFLIKHKVMFGQLIFEEADRGYSKVHWNHLSMGAPFRDLHRCGQILTMKDGKYTLIDKVDFEWWR